MNETIKGKISIIKDVQKGTSKAGKEWQKLEFVITNNDGYEGKEQLFCFELFGAEKVENFIKFNKLGKEVEVSFNISCNAWEGKHFTSLQAWKVFGIENATTNNTAVEEVTDNLPF